MVLYYTLLAGFEISYIVSWDLTYHSALIHNIMKNIGSKRVCDPWLPMHGQIHQIHASKLLLCFTKQLKKNTGLKKHGESFSDLCPFKVVFQDGVLHCSVALYSITLYKFVLHRPI